jgi:hypothetical protein
VSELTRFGPSAEIVTGHRALEAAADQHSDTHEGGPLDGRTRTDG